VLFASDTNTILFSTTAATNAKLTQNRSRQPNRSLREWHIKLVKTSKDSKIICILDGLDECTLDSLRSFVPKLMECVTTPRNVKNGTIKALATIRPKWDIQRIFGNLEHPNIKLSSESHEIRTGLRKDVDKVIEERLKLLNIHQRHFDRVRGALQIVECWQSPYLWMNLVFEVLAELSCGNFEGSEWKRLLDCSLQESLVALPKLLEPASTAKWSGPLTPGFEGHQHPLYGTIRELVKAHLQNLLGDRPEKRRFAWKQTQNMVCNGTALTADGPSLAVIKGELFAVWRAHDGTDQLWWAKLHANDQDPDPKRTE